MEAKLCPAQQQAFAGLSGGLLRSNLHILSGGSGMGKTTVLRETHARSGGAFLTMKEFVDAMQERHPLALEETFGQLVMEALMAHPVVIVDELELLTNVVGGMCSGYPRAGFLGAPLSALAT